MSRRRTAIGAGAVVAVALAAAFTLPLGEWAIQLVESIRGAGLWGVMIYVAAYVVAAVLLLPGSILTLGAGFAYGPWWGTALVSPASVTAATLAFVLGRTIARDWVARRTGADPRFRAIDAAIARQGLRIVLLLRLSPAFPFNVLNYALGLTSVRLRDFVLGSFVGMLPGTFMYVYLGSLVSDVAALSAGAAAGGTARQVLSIVGLVATVAVTIVITRLARRALREELSDGVAVADAPLSESPR